MYRRVKHKSELGILCIVMGIIIFIGAAGAFLIKLMFALMGLWLIAYGVELHTGKSLNIVFLASSSRLIYFLSDYSDLNRVNSPGWVYL